MKATEPDARGPSKVVRLLTLLGLVIATLVAYASIRDAQWILFDDPAYVTRNKNIASGFTLDGLRWVFAHPHGGNFHPLTSFSHMLDCELFGLDPRGPHIENVALHALDAVLLCLVLARFTGAWWRSLLVAAFFALHPAHVESVAWISERKDVLSTLFFLLTLLAYQRWTQRSSRSRYVLVAVLFVLGLLAKPMLVTLPFVLLILDVWPLKRARWPLFGTGMLRLWLEKWPLFAIAGVSAVATFFVQNAAGAVMTAQTLSIPQRIANALASYGRYLKLIFAPHDLAIYYPLTDGWPIEEAIGGLVFIVIATTIAWCVRSKRPYALVGWTWFLGTLVPVIGLVQVGAQAYADRYTYIPSIGIAIVVVWLVADFVADSRAARAAAGVVAAFLLGWCGVATARQTALWKDTRTLFTHALAVAPPNAVAYQNLGNALLMDGEIDRAIECLRESLRIIPDFPDAENNLGTALGIRGRHEEAIPHFRAALRTENTAEIHQNLGWSLAQSGRGDEAIVEYEAALALDPEFAAAHAKLGATVMARGQRERAERHIVRALALDPNDVETHRSLAILRTQQGRVEDGIQAYRGVLERAPNDLDALNNIAWIRATHADGAHRDGVEAVHLSEKARDLPHDPNHVLFSTLAAAYAEAGRFEEAVKAGERAVQLADEAKDSDAAQRFAQQLASYRVGRPFHY